MSTEEKKINDDKTVSSNQELESQNKVCGIAALPGLEFRSKTVFAVCPTCKVSGPTVVESTWNLKSCLCCYYYGGYWKCWNLLKGNDWTAKNGLHTCSSCNGTIKNYQAC